MIEKKLIDLKNKSIPFLCRGAFFIIGAAFVGCGVLFLACYKALIERSIKKYFSLRYNVREI